jgi:hypothetical protein
VCPCERITTASKMYQVSPCVPQLWHANIYYRPDQRLYTGHHYGLYRPWTVIKSPGSGQTSRWMMKACVHTCEHHNSFKDASGKPLYASVMAHEHSSPSRPTALYCASRMTLPTVDSHQSTWIGSDIQTDDESLCAHVWASKQLHRCIR